MLLDCWDTHMIGKKTTMPLIIGYTKQKIQKEKLKKKNHPQILSGTFLNIVFMKTKDILVWVEPKRKKNILCFGIDILNAFICSYWVKLDSSSSSLPSHRMHIVWFRSVFEVDFPSIPAYCALLHIRQRFQKT